MKDGYTLVANKEENEVKVVQVKKKKGILCAGTRKRLYMLLVLSILSLVWVFVYYKLLNHKFSLPEPLQKLRDLFGDGVAKKRRGREEETEVMIVNNTGNCLPQFSVPRAERTIHIAMVACSATNINEALTSLKSLFLTTNVQIFLHVFTDNAAEIEKHLHKWPAWQQRWMMYVTYPITYPVAHKEWVNIFKPCATQRLFLAEALPTYVDTVIYVDTDTLFLEPVEKLAAHFAHMNDEQFAGMTSECGEIERCWYNAKTQHPFYPPAGLNSGVMLINMTRMRLHLWQESMVNIYTQYKTRLMYGNQDILNIYFSLHPNQVYTLPCQWNYRPHHCLHGNNCLPAKHGISLLHVNRHVFIKPNLQKDFHHVYKVFNEFNFHQDLQHHLTHKLQRYFENVENPKDKCADFLKTSLLKFIQCPD